MRYIAIVLLGSGLTLSLPMGAAAHAEPFAFSNVSARAGLSEISLSSTAWIAAGVAFVDLDGDHWPDLYFGAGEQQHDQLCLNQRDGTFRCAPMALVNARAVLGVVAGDYDNDGDVDLYVMREGPNTLLQNDGKAHFTDVSKATGAAGDPTRYTATATFLDYDGDGLLDLFLGHWDASEADPQAAPQLLRQGPPGKFVDTTSGSGIDTHDVSSLTSLAWDYDGDGLTNLYVGADFDFPSLFHNKGDGTFEDVTHLQPAAFTQDVTEGMGTDIADFDGDGDFDLYISNAKRPMGPNGSGFFSYLGDGTFASLAPQLGIQGDFGWGTGFVDFDNDGWPDIFVAGDIAPTHFLFHNTGQGGFVTETMPSGYMGIQNCVTAAFADYDNDGKVDMVVARMDGRPPELWRNVTATTNHWLQVSLRGDHRDTIGALVTIDGRDHPLKRELLSESSHSSQNDRRLAFGLGASAAPVSVTVRWPAGTTTMVQKVSPDQEITIAEDVGLVPDQPAARGCAVLPGARGGSSSAPLPAALLLLYAAQIAGRRRSPQRSEP